MVDTQAICDNNYKDNNDNISQLESLPKSIKTQKHEFLKMTFLTLEYFETIMIVT